MSLYLGIDGGGTKTRFLLGDEGRVLAEATTDGSNLLRSGEAEVQNALHTGIEQACSSAGVKASEIVRTVAGIAGSSNPQVHAKLEQMLEEAVSGEIVVLGDMVIAHHAALEGRPGVLINAGTGSIAYGRNAAGETARAGGWGFAISDEGSGHWIGRVALATAMRCFDSRREEGYLHHLTTAMLVKEPQELARLANSTANPDLAAVFPAVVRIADLGDETARKILVHAGAELACMVDTILANLFPNDAEVQVAATGGVFRNSSAVLESCREDLIKAHPNVRFSLSEAEPAVGALALARQPL